MRMQEVEKDEDASIKLTPLDFKALAEYSLANITFTNHHFLLIEPPRKQASEEAHKKEEACSHVDLMG